MPSASTSERLGDVPPTPRNATPCAVGFAFLEEVRRNNVNPGTTFRASSIVIGALVSRSFDEMTVMVDVGSTRGASPREEVTFTASNSGAGCSVTSTVRTPAGADVVESANPGTATTIVRAASAVTGTSNRPFASVYVSATRFPATSTRTFTLTTAAPLGSMTRPLN